MKTTSLIALFATAILAAPALEAQDAINLKPVWQVGKVYNQSQDINMVMTLPGIGEQKINMKMEVSSAVTADGDDKLLSMKVDAISMNMNMAGTELTYDSRKPGAGGPLAMMGEVVGKESVVVFDADDNFKSVKKMPEIAGLGEANPFGNEEAVKNMIGESMRAMFPEEPVSPGDKWKGDSVMDLGKMGTMTVKSDVEFESMEERDGTPQAKLNFAGAISGEIKAEEAGGMAVKFGEGSKQSGTMYFDPKVGTVTRLEMDATMNMEVAGTKMPMKQKVVQTLTSIEDIEE